MNPKPSSERSWSWAVSIVARINLMQVGLPLLSLIWWLLSDTILACRCLGSLIDQLEHCGVEISIYGSVWSENNTKQLSSVEGGWGWRGSSFSSMSRSTLLLCYSPKEQPFVFQARSVSTIMANFDNLRSAVVVSYVNKTINPFIVCMYVVYMCIGVVVVGVHWHGVRAVGHRIQVCLVSRLESCSLVKVILWWVPNC